MSSQKASIALFLAAGVVFAAGAVPAETVPAPDPTRAVAVFISQRMFSEEVLQVVARRLEVKGYRPIVVAKDTALATGMDQTVVRPDLALEACRPGDFAALVVINGSGIATCWQDTLLQARCREFAAAGKVTGSVGIASICLARAGVLRGHKATILPERHAVRELLAGGARYWPNPVVTDRSVITASDTQYALKFTDVLAKVLDIQNRQQ